MLQSSSRCVRVDVQPECDDSNNCKKRNVGDSNYQNVNCVLNYNHNYVCGVTGQSYFDSYAKKYNETLESLSEEDAYEVEERAFLNNDEVTKAYLLLFNEYQNVDECVLNYFVRQKNLIVKKEEPEVPEELEPELEEETPEINSNGKLIKKSLFACATLLFVL